MILEITRSASKCYLYITGANDWGTGKYMADITSYDYDAVMDEAGDPNNPKYQYVKDVIEQYFHLSSKPLPQRVPKMSISPITLAPVESILSSAGRRYLGRRHGNSSSNPSVDFKDDNTVENVSEENSERDSSDETDTAGVASILYENPISFEAINQYSGLVLYETDVPATDKIDPTLLKVNGLRDRALVFLDGRYVGILSRENAISSMPLSVGDAKRLQILVENQGRINFNIANDIKGILGNVTLQQLDGQHQVLNNWSIVGYPLTNYAHLKEFVANADDDNVVLPDSGMLLNGPVVFSADFNIPNDNIHDTYLNPSGWGKVRNLFLI